MLKIKKALLIFLLTPLIAMQPVEVAADPVQLSSNIFLWFDLGNALIETRDGFDQLRWMPGAFEMIQALKEKNYKIGIISNVPEDWGQPGDAKSKIGKLQRVLNEGWIDAQPIDLAIFDKIFVSMGREDAKPSEKLFFGALRWAERSGCHSFFQGESPREVSTAAKVGMSSHLIEFDASGRRPKYFPVADLHAVLSKENP